MLISYRVLLFNHFVLHFMTPVTWPNRGVLGSRKVLTICMQDGISLILVTGFHRAAEEDVEAQRQELMAGFDDAQRKREHEFRKKLDDLSNSLLASELKVRAIVFVLYG